MMCSRASRAVSPGVASGDLGPQVPLMHDFRARGLQRRLQERRPGSLYMLNVRVLIAIDIIAQDTAEPR